VAGCSYGCLVGPLCGCVSAICLGVLTDVLLVLCGCVFCYVDGCSGGFLEIHCFVVLSIVSLANLVCA